MHEFKNSNIATVYSIAYYTFNSIDFLLLHCTINQYFIINY
ncbi:hypothetical protein CTK_C07590 [Clostridium tyrobutyricum]|nr:hypothetical protein CTK_C07590 [Clostridium tyrobutyricum]